MQKKYYFLKLIPPRSSFIADMTEEERAVMHAHIAYWAPHVEAGTMIVMGPVADPNGGWGLGVMAVDHEAQLDELVKNDPANGLSHYEIYPMMSAKHKN
jgi:uncharacterized protein